MFELLVCDPRDPIWDPRDRFEFESKPEHPWNINDPRFSHFEKFLDIVLSKK